MEIVKIESLAEVTTGDVYYELRGKFYAKCWACGKLVEIDCLRTASDLRFDDIGEESYFCNEECERKWFISSYSSVEEAYAAGEEDRADRFMTADIQYERHQMIEVHHQYGVKTYECESFWDHACEWGGLSAYEYQTIEEAEAALGEDLPDELAELLKTGPAVELIYRDGVNYELLDGFNKEEYGLDILGEDLHQLICLDSEEEAREIAEKYTGHEWIAVRSAARGIIRAQRNEHFA